MKKEERRRGWRWYKGGEEDEKVEDVAEMGGEEEDEVEEVERRTGGKG